jgi:hypothetical protein
MPGPSYNYKYIQTTECYFISIEQLPFATSSGRSPRRRCPNNGGNLMKHRFRVHSLAVGALMLFMIGSAAAQINPNPNCNSGAEGRPSFLGILGRQLQ